MLWNENSQINCKSVCFAKILCESYIMAWDVKNMLHEKSLFGFGIAAENIGETTKRERSDAASLTATTS